MTTEWTKRPARDEYADFYHAYVECVPDGDVREAFADGIKSTLNLLAGFAPDRADFAYAPGKWTVKEIVGHLADAERVFAYRALRFGRGDTTPLPGFEQDDYVRLGGFGRRPLTDLADEFEHLRRANLLLFRAFDESALQRRGVASGREVSVRALLWITAGHERHHLKVLRERYLLR